MPLSSPPPSSIKQTSASSAFPNVNTSNSFSLPLSKFNGYILLLLGLLLIVLFSYESVVTSLWHPQSLSLLNIQDTNIANRGLSLASFDWTNVTKDNNNSISLIKEEEEEEGPTYDVFLSFNDNDSSSNINTENINDDGDSLIKKKKAAGKLNYNYTFWSSDFHISPIADIKDILVPLGHKIIDKSLSGHCHLTHTCQKNLKVLTKGNGINLGKCPNSLRKEFYKTYKNDPEMKNVDAFLCNHAAGLCEVFMPFKKPMIIIASTRYEIGREDKNRWEEWNRNLKAIHSNPRNIIAANNLYDAEYIKYFTGIQDVIVLQSFCAYTNVHYKPSRKEILIGPGRGVKPKILQQLKEAGSKNGLSLAPLRDLYPHFEYSDLIQHRVIVLIPYQVSIMSIFEYYRMEIPIFVPSPKLLAKWQLEYRLMNERTWSGVYGKFKSKSNIEKDSAIVDNPHLYIKDLNKYDPNNENDPKAIEFWIQFSDFYVWPYIKTFDSIDELMTMLKSHNDEDLLDISKQMRIYNEETKADLLKKWNYIIHERMFPNNEPPASIEMKPQISQSYEEALQEQYGIIAGPGCYGDQHP